MPANPFWAGDYLKTSTSNKHFCTVGTTGSGKTITLLLLMQSVLPALATEPDQRALIYDAKRDLLSYLYPMVGKVPIHVLNPFDRRSSRWDLAKDITTPLAAQQTAAIFVPKEQNSNNPFFSDAARLLLQGIFLALAHRLETRGKSWTLRDVLLIGRSRLKMQRLFAQCPFTTEIAFYVHPTTREATSILATLGTKLLPFEPVAAAWENATQSFSLTGWIKENSTLVLGNDESARTALDAINQAIFQRATELVLSQNESEQRRTWFILDEVREAGMFSGLPRLMTKGRTKGACVALGFQDIEGMRDAYGEKIANEIVGQCNSKAILRINSPETARWASELRGTYLRWERQTSSSCSQAQSQDGGSSTSEESETLSLAERSAAYTSEFFDLPFPNPVEGMTAFYITDEGFYRKTYNPFPLLPRRDALIKDFWKRADSEQYLLPWREEEEKRFADSLGAVAPQLSDEGKDARAEKSEGVNPVEEIDSSPTVPLPKAVTENSTAAGSFPDEKIPGRDKTPKNEAVTADEEPRTASAYLLPESSSRSLPGAEESVGKETVKEVSPAPPTPAPDSDSLFKSIRRRPHDDEGDDQ